jgi:hypothetical protein
LEFHLADGEQYSDADPEQGKDDGNEEDLSTPDREYDYKEGEHEKEDDAGTEKKGNNIIVLHHEHVILTFNSEYSKRYRTAVISFTMAFDIIRV